MPLRLLGLVILSLQVIFIVLHACKSLNFTIVLSCAQSFINSILVCTEVYSHSLSDEAAHLMYIQVNIIEITVPL